MNCKKEMELICAEFRLTVADVEERLIELGDDGLLLEKKTEKMTPVSYDDRPLGLHLNRFYFAMASLVLKNVENVLEIGTGRGDSTATLSSLFPEATVYTVNLPDVEYKKLYPDESDLGRKRRLKNLNRENIVYIKKNSFFLPVSEFSDKFELILVDADKDYPQVAGDIMFAYNRITDGGFVFIHDVNFAHSSKNDVCPAVNWVDKHVPERVFFFPQLTSSNMSSVKMALLVKGRGE